MGPMAGALSELFTPAVGSVADSAAGVPTFVFPHAGGSPRFFHMWSSHWQWGPVWGVTYPGRDARLTEPMPAHVQALAAQVGEELAVHLRRHPLPTVRFFGHSLGAVVAYETAIWLLAHRLQWDPARTTVIQLVVSGHNAPHISYPPDYVQVHNKPTEKLVEEMVRVDPRNAEIFAIPELAALLIPAIREDYRLAETYRSSQTSLFVDEIVVVAGEEDPDCFLEGLEGWKSYWRKWGGVHLQPGGHFYLAEYPESVPGLLARLTGGRWRGVH